MIAGKIMSDICSDEERDVLNPSNMSRLSEEIKRKKNSPTTRGMFVSGWDDADADQGVSEEKNPHGTFNFQQHLFDFF